MRTDDKLEELCDALERNYGDMHTAARQCGVSPRFVMQWLKDDREAGARLQEAQRVGAMGLESAAVQRAVHGVAQDVYYKGDVVGQKVEYSDTLLKTLMEARIPEFRKGEGGNSATFNGPTQINIMPRANNYQEWLEMKSATKMDALPAPAEKIPLILQGDYVEVEAVEDPMACLKGLGI